MSTSRLASPAHAIREYQVVLQLQFAGVIQMGVILLKAAALSPGLAVVGVAFALCKLHV